MRLRIPATVATAVLALALGALPAQTALAAPLEDPDPVGTVDPVDPALYAEVTGGKEVRVNVVTASRADLASTASAGETLHTFSQVPVKTLRVDAAGLDTLSGIPGVVSVTEDVPVPPSLNETTTLIGADKTTVSGWDGSGSAIAVLDTGVAQNHPFLGGRVTQQACFSTTDATSGATSLCPNGTDEQEGPGSADSESGPCATLGAACSHGTHVAGIAAGNGKDLTGAPRQGVAPGAEIYAIQVFSKFTSAEYCGAQAPCVLSFTSDQLAGLEKVYALKQAGKPVIAANMSLGGGRYTSACTTDARKAIIDNLFNAGVATVVAAGNNAYTNAVNSPGCVPNAVTVGATTDADQLAAYTNRGPLVDLFAPGHGVVSSVPGNAYATKNGSSMATPHVAGALAVLRKAAPQAPLGTLIQALASTGKAVTYTEGTTPRIQLDQAVALVRADALPEPAAKPRPSTVTDTRDYLIPGRGSGSVTTVPLTTTLPGNAPADLQVEYSVDGVGFNNLTVDLIAPDGKSYRLETSATPRALSEELSSPMVAGPIGSLRMIDASASPAAGQWKLRVENGYGTWEGTMLFWTLHFPAASSAPGTAAVPDLGSVDSTATVSGFGGNASTATQVYVDLDHQRREDLELSLVSPGGKSYTLAPAGSLWGSGSTDYIYSVDASDSPADGTWTLRTRDAVTGNTGTLKHWSVGFLSYENQTPAAIPATGTVESASELEDGWSLGLPGNAPGAVRVYVDLTHQRVGDLKLDLVAPDGAVYPLKSAGGQPGGNLRQIFTVHPGASPVEGIWKLRIDDATAGNSGTLNNWSLVF
ncbi:proprotein convertase P-domain-containing protein [Streptomyces sp. NPDC094032]|uniref:proprotein convertase P-domain-containing protein n=1 Tax=Streptomyces sp. NPDC094032 TaxID=3155308 RepID=UPI00331AE2FC